MRYLITVFLVGAILAGSVCAEGENPGNVQEQNQQLSAEMSQYTAAAAESGTSQSSSASSSGAEGGEASAGAIIVWDYTTNSYVTYPKYRVPPVSPIPAPLAWPYPSQWFLWNTVDTRDVLTFQREWNLKDIRDSIRRISYKGPLEFAILGTGELLGLHRGLAGKGFKWQIYLFDQKLRPKSKPTVTTIIQDVNMAVFSQKYTCIGLIGMETEEKLFIPQTIAGAIDEVSAFDWDVGLLRPGMNLVNSSSGISPGVSGVSGGIHNTFALVAGVSVGKAKVTGEGGVSLILYRKNGEKKVPKDLLSAIAERDKEEKMPGVPVSPELMELYKKAENQRR